MKKLPHSSSALLILSLLTILTVPSVAYAQDANCLYRAIDKRSQDLRNAYQTYANNMTNAVNQLTDGEHHAVGNPDPGYFINDTYSSLSRFSYDVNILWQNLSTSLMYAWDTYYRERSQCGFGPAPTPANAYNYNDYRYRDRGLCLEQVLPTPPAGCNYKCINDVNGCQQCRLSCRSGVSNSCNCPSTYAPVCTRDGRTYSNACLAVCDQGVVLRYGTCN